MSLPFPRVPIAPHENLEEAYQRVLQAFAQAGLQTREIPADKEWQFCARMFAAATDAALYVFIVNVRGFDAEEEQSILFTASKLCNAFILKTPVHFIAYAPQPFSETLAYMLGDAGRMVFVIACTNIVNDFYEKAESVSKVAGLVAASCVALRGKFEGKPESITAIAEWIVLNVLRTEKDPWAENHGFRPLGPLVGLGCLFGDALRDEINTYKTLEAKWIDLNDEILLQIHAKVSKGFLRGSERIHLLTANPINKVIKLFDHGSEDSIESFHRSTIAMLRHLMEEKGLNLE